MIEIWDRRSASGESPAAHAALLAYLELGPERSLARLSAQLGRPAGYVRHLERWSSRYGWASRAAAWDEHQRQRQHERHVQLVDAALAQAYEGLGGALTELVALTDGAEKESVRIGAIRLILEVTGVLKRDVPQQTVNVQAAPMPLPVEGLSDETLADLEAELVRRLGSGGGGE